MISNSFIELSDSEVSNVDGGSLFGEILMWAGGVVVTCASGPVAFGVAIGCAVIGGADILDL